MNLEKWKQLCRKAWENDHDYLQNDRFAKTGEIRYTIRNCVKTTYIECTPEINSSLFLYIYIYIYMIYSIKER